MCKLCCTPAIRWKWLSLELVKESSYFANLSASREDKWQRFPITFPHAWLKSWATNQDICIYFKISYLKSCFDMKPFLLMSSASHKPIWFWQSLNMVIEKIIYHELIFSMTAGNLSWQVLQNLFSQFWAVEKI